MKIYTSYFNKLRSLKDDYILISISRYRPKYIKPYYRFEELAPSENLLRLYKHDNLTKREYITKYYNETLGKISSADDIYSRFLKIYEKHKKPILLLCYEKSDDFCHRHIVSNWLNMNVSSKLIKKNYIKELIEEGVTKAHESYNRKYGYIPSGSI